jgi:hypothetical protein
MGRWDTLAVMSFVHSRATLVVALASLVALACGPASPRSMTPTVAGDPTPLAKCKVAASSSSPLVTEWPASEKAHLQSMASSQLIAVEYSGCELHIVDGCALAGTYAWSRTTLATDTIDIASADELYAKLPLGAVGLEGELARSGHLAVRTTVAGQLRATGVTSTSPDAAACARATHYVSAISVGAFQLLSGEDAKARGGATVGNVGAGGATSRRELVLREAGTRDACDHATDQAPDTQCGSPIQVFLAPLTPKSSAGSATGGDAQGARPTEARATGVHIAIPAPADHDETWTLRAPGGHAVCTLPCDAWVGPVSGMYLQREPRNGVTTAAVPLPESFAHPVGSEVVASYQAERGNPDLSKWTFYLLGAPFGLIGVGFTIWGGVMVASCGSGDTGFCDMKGFVLGYGLFALASGGASLWWYLWSHPKRFDTYEKLPDKASVHFGPGFVTGTF